MSCDVAVVPCADYDPARVAMALETALEALGGLDWVRPGMKIAVKPNLVGPFRPESAAVTHPAVVAGLCALLARRGAAVTVGDSPGGPWTGAWVGAVYAASGMKAAESAGARLNRDFSQEDVAYPKGAVLKRFLYTSWLRDADAVIDCCKLKTHGLTAMSCAVKNLFGVVPGTRKPELHYLYPNLRDFSHLLVDLCEYVKPRLTVVDAVECMQGNGPSQGTPRHMGALICANSPYDADLVCARLIGLRPRDVPTVAAAVSRGLCPESADSLRIHGDLGAFTLPDFKQQPPAEDIALGGRGSFARRLWKKAFGSGPRVSRAGCVGCGKCAEICPAKAVAIRKGRAVIQRNRCIRCYCCQEFCPKGAVTIHRPFFARLMG